MSMEFALLASLPRIVWMEQDLSRSSCNNPENRVRLCDIVYLTCEKSDVVMQPLPDVGRGGRRIHMDAGTKAGQGDGGSRFATGKLSRHVRNLEQRLANWANTQGQPHVTWGWVGTHNSELFWHRHCGQFVHFSGCFQSFLQVCLFSGESYEQLIRHEGDWYRYAFFVEPCALTLGRQEVGHPPATAATHHHHTVTKTRT